MPEVLIIGSSVDSSGWEAALTKLAATTGTVLKRALRQETRNVVKGLYDFTPPRSQGQGEGATARDIKRVFTPRESRYLAMIVDHFGAHQVRQILRRKDGTPYLIEADIIDLSGAGMEAFHQSKRLKNGTVSTAGLGDPKTGRWIASDTMWVPHDAFAAYLAKIKRRVGISKAGWLPAMDALGVPAASWVTRHRGAGGFVDNQLADAVAPRFVAGNDLAYFRGGKNVERVARNVFRSREKRLLERIDKELEKQAQAIGLAAS